MFRLLGFDTGLANFGYAELIVDGRRSVFGRVGVITTTANHKKRRIRKSDDTSDRVIRISREVNQLIKQGPPGKESCPVVALCTEAPELPFGRTRASVVSGLGRARGLLDAFAACYDLPIIEDSPQGLKKFMTGKANASKVEVQKAAERLYPALKHLWPKSEKLHEHAADAASTCLMGLESDVVKAIIRLSRK